jgi:branched-chain amino acid transport system ATP-binding protein
VSVLEVNNIEVIYDDVVVVLRGVSLVVPDGSIVALLGANGAGKTTTLRAISGLLPSHNGDITKGFISLEGDDITRLDAADIVRAGVTQALEGRRIFASLSVDDNLRAGAFTNTNRSRTQEHYDRVLTIFPVLANRRKATAGYLSGGEQQMLAIGRALMSDPKLLLLDEPSLGLAPLLVQQIRDIIVEINEQGTSVLLVEQNAQMALSIAHHGYVMENGKIVMDNPASKLLANEDVREFYLGIAEERRKSFSDVKHYKRKKRWLS